ncbi:MAG: F0F1 ATP synthase subunit A [Patescibacteria group bacterium]
MEGIHISLQPEIIGHIGAFPVSNSFLLSFFTAVLLVGGGLFLVRSLRLMPGKLQNGAEIVVGGMLDFGSQVLGGDRDQAKRFFPLVAAFFLFILLNNWMGILPGVGAIGLEEVYGGESAFVPLLRSANSDLNTTLALALVSVFAVQLYGMRRLGFFSYLSKFFQFRGGPVQIFVGLLELVSEFAKVLSFSFRLFGNVFAGEVLLVVTMALVPVIVPVPFFALEIFVGFIQAFIFAMLTLIFLKIATETVEH